MSTPHILIVDDDPMVRDTTKQLLERVGMRVHCAQSWADVSTLLVSHNIAVILLDVMMPSLRGDALAPILQRHATEGTTIALYSSTPERQLRETAEAAGCPYIHKGAVAGRDLVEAVKALLPPR